MMTGEINVINTQEEDRDGTRKRIRFQNDDRRQAIIQRRNKFA